MPAKSSAGAGTTRARCQANTTKTSKRGAAEPALVERVKAGTAATRKAAAKKSKVVAKSAFKKSASKKSALHKFKSANPVGKKKSPAKTPKGKAPPKGKSVPKRKSHSKVDATRKTEAPIADVIEAPHEVTQAGAKSAAKRKTAPKPNSLVLKVLGTINGELTKLDEHTGKSSQDRERASRALSQMVTSLEKAVSMQRQMARDKGTTNAAKDQETLRHAEDMRRQIAERLERLNHQRKMGGRTEGPDGG